VFVTVLVGRGMHPSRTDLRRTPAHVCRSSGWDSLGIPVLLGGRRPLSGHPFASGKGCGPGALRRRWV